MAQRRTAFRWTLRYEDPLMAGEVEERVREVVAIWMRLYPKIYSDGWVTGAAVGVIQAGVVVTRRDQWACSRESQRFATALALRAKVRVREVRDPDPLPLPPHQHRGARRFEAPKYAEVGNGS